MAEAEAEKAKQKVKYFEDQFEDEDVLYVFRKHPVVMRKGIVLWAAGMLLGPIYILIMLSLHPNPPQAPTTGTFFAAVGASFLLSLILFAPSYIGWYFSVFIVTNQRFIQITQKGFFHRAVADLSLQQIQSVNYEVAGLQETLLGFGTIKMQTYVGDMTIHDVHHPAKIQKRMLQILREEGLNTNPYPSPNQTNPQTTDTDEES